MDSLKIKKLSENAVIPTRNNPTDAGLDLYSVDECSLRPGERRLFKTNIAMEIPAGYYGRIADRSGNAYKKGLHVLAGVIDETYRGDVGVVLVNLGTQSVPFFVGDKIAQIIIEKYYTPEIQEVTDLSETDRGEKGYGSSDKPTDQEVIDKIGKVNKDSEKSTEELVRSLTRPISLTTTRPGFGPFSPKFI